MDSFKVTDEGGGIIRVDAETSLMRKPLAEAICGEVNLANRYGEFKILMNLGAISKGTPGAGLYTLRAMKQYNLSALALYGANGFMRGMANVVLGLAGFSNFALFDDEASARAWLERADEEPAAPSFPPASPDRRLGGVGLPVGAVALGGVASWIGLRRLEGTSGSALVVVGGGAAVSGLGLARLRRRWAAGGGGSAHRLG